MDSERKIPLQVFLCLVGLSNMLPPGLL